VLETLLRVLLVTSDLPTPLTQYWIIDGEEPVLRADFAWPAARLIVEADGFAFHSDRSAYRRDRTTMNALERLGWRVLRFSYEDVVGRPGYVVGLVRACLASAS
jgi:very-short-patch-repair endonuclease